MKKIILSLLIALSFSVKAQQLNIFPPVNFPISSTNGGTGLSSFPINSILYGSSANVWGTSPNLTYNGTMLQIGSGTMPYTADKINCFTTASGHSAVFQNPTSNAFSSILLSESATNYGVLYRFNSTYVGNYSGSSVATANSFNFQSGAGNDKPFVINAIPFVVYGGTTGTNIGMRVDLTGVRIDAVSNLHTSPTAKLHIAAGTAAASSAPLKFSSGVASQTTPEQGAINYDGSNLFISDASNNYQFVKSFIGSASLDFPSTTATTISDLTIAVTGASLGDPVTVGVPNGSQTATGSYVAWVSSAGVVTIRYSPKATEDPLVGTFKVTVIKN